MDDVIEPAAANTPAPMVAPASHAEAMRIVSVAPRPPLRADFAARLYGKPLAVMPTAFAGFVASLSATFQAQHQTHLLTAALLSARGSHPIEVEDDDDDSIKIIVGVDDDVIVPLQRTMRIIDIDAPLIRQHIDDPCSEKTIGYNWIRYEIEEAASDPATRFIVLRLQTPGGEVEGCFEFCRWFINFQAAMTASGSDIECLTFGISCMASAGQAIGLSVPKGNRFATPTTLCGSIGVIVCHEDWSVAEAMMGVKMTPITSAPEKDALSPHKPLDEAGRGLLESLMLAAWVGPVGHPGFRPYAAAQLGVAEDIVQSWNSAAMSAPDAMARGIIDGMMDWDDFVDMLTSRLDAATDTITTSGVSGVEEKTAMSAKMNVGKVKGDTTPPAGEKDDQKDAEKGPVDPNTDNGKQPYMMLPPVHAEGDMVIPNRPGHAGVDGVPHMVTGVNAPQHAYSIVPHSEGMTLDLAKGKPSMSMMEGEMAKMDSSVETRKAQDEAKAANARAEASERVAAMERQESLEAAIEGKGIDPNSPQGHQIQGVVKANVKPGQTMRAAVNEAAATFPLMFGTTSTDTSKGEKTDAKTEKAQESTTRPPVRTSTTKPPTTADLGQPKSETGPKMSAFQAKMAEQRALNAQRVAASENLAK